jgi:hypothetical protein
LATVWAGFQELSVGRSGCFQSAECPLTLRDRKEKFRLLLCSVRSHEEFKRWLVTPAVVLLARLESQVPIILLRLVFDALQASTYVVLADRAWRSRLRHEEHGRNEAKRHACEFT